MSANLIPITSDGGFTTAGNITGNIANVYAMNISQSITWSGDSSVYEDTSLVLQGNVSVSITSPNTTQITANTSTWSFDNTGNLTIPGNLVITGNTSVFGSNVALLQSNPDLPLLSISSGSNGGTSSLWVENIGGIGSSNIAAVYTNPTVGSGIVRIAVGQNGGNSGPNLWDFNANGSISFPDSSVQTTAYTGGFGGNTDWANIGNINNTNGPTKLAIGQNAGSNTQGNSAVAIGIDAGENNQGFISIAIGAGAGGNGQGQAAVAIGTDTGANIQGIEAIAIGFKAGNQGQGQQSIAIGAKAGNVNQGNNSIILNATGNPLDQTTANTFTVSPVRNDTSNIAEVMFYNATSKEVTYGNTISVAGNVTANNFIGNGSQLTGIPTQTTGNWTLTPGVNTANINVPTSGTYSIWINGNIPNGIITYTATAVVTNTNVPVLGEQYGWYYLAGNALVLTSIPNQFVGTQGVISNAAPYSGNTANVFTFGITNNSGANAVVSYGYTKL